MKFYSDTAANSGININGELIMFEDGVIETTDKNVIAALSGRYRSDEIAKTEQRDTARPKVEAEQEETEAQTEEITDEGIDFEEMTVVELRDLARAEGVSPYKEGKPLKRDELIEALRGD